MASKYQALEHWLRWCSSNPEYCHPVMTLEQNVTLYVQTFPKRVTPLLLELLKDWKQMAQEAAQKKDA